MLLSDGLWASNADGTGVVRLVDFNQPTPGRVADLQAAVSPRGGHIAYISFTDEFMFGMPHLMILSLPQGGIQTITDLMYSLPEAEGADEDALVNTLAAVAFEEASSVAWSSDGSRLAFIGAQHGPTADLYLYEAGTGTILRLSQGPTEAITPRWSPDDRLILHGGVTDMQFGASGRGYTTDAYWTARPDGSGITEVFRIGTYVDEHFLGWISDNTYVEYYWTMGCDNYRLQAVDVRNGHATPLSQGFFSYAALDPTSQTALVSVPDWGSDDMCHHEAPGLYLINVRTASSARVFDRPAMDTFYPLEWSQEAGLFFAFTWNGLVGISTAGEVLAFDVPTQATPVVSPNGAYWAFTPSNPYGRRATGVWVGELYAEPRLVHSQGATPPIWTPDGQAILFISGDRLYVASAPQFEPHAVTSGLSPSYDFQAVWVYP